MSVNRRRFCQLGSGLLAGLLVRDISFAKSESPNTAIPALLPQDNSGHHFILYSDCTSGSAGQPQAHNLQLVNAVLKRINPQPEFIVFPGDAVMGYTQDYGELRRQWNYFYDIEMNWLQTRKMQLYQATSNHNTYDEGSETVFREVHSQLPQNGPAGQKGLAYFIREGNCLIVFTHQPHRRPSIDYEWLDRVLHDNADAKYKFVTGHYPVFPVNGYVASPQWCFPPHLRTPFWDIMIKHRVDAYLASHVIAFDVQVHAGLLQIVSAGAGSVFGPGGFMRGKEEYLHAVQMAVDDRGLRYQVHDTQGDIRDQLVWPFSLPALPDWHILSEETINETMANIQWDNEIVAIRARGVYTGNGSGEFDQTMISSFHTATGPVGEIEPLWIGIAGDSNRLMVRIVPVPGGSWQEWKGPVIDKNQAFDYQIALHSGMGPGGILLRKNKADSWSSLESVSNKGISDFRPPTNWTFGYGQSGKSDRPFGGKDLRVEFTRQDMPKAF